MKRRAALALILLTCTAPTIAQPVQVEKRVAALVVIKTPTGVTRSMIEAGFAKSVPLYQKAPGLLRKYFTVNDNGFGGIYLWESRAAADAWFSTEWRARAKATYGVEPELTYFDTPLQIDNTPAISK